MSLLRDAHAEFEQDLGEECLHYPYVNPNQEGDFWQEEGGWNRDDPNKFDAIIMASISDDILEDPGFSDDAEVAARTTYSQVEKRDLVAYGGQEWAVDSVSEGRVQGGGYIYILGLLRHDE